MSRKRAVLVLLLLLGAVGWVAAQDLTINEHRFISPISIPVNTTGVSNIGISRLKVRDSSGTAGCTITSLRVVPSTDYGTGFDPAWISGIKVYLEMNGATWPGEYDHGSTADAVDDVLVSTGYTWMPAIRGMTSALMP